MYMKGLFLDKRYDFYYYGICVKRLYLLWMVDGIVFMGLKVIFLLRDKFFIINSFFEKMIIIYLLFVMLVYGCYDVKFDSELFLLVM